MLKVLFNSKSVQYRYFKHNNLYGLGCYARLKIENKVERGARMKTVAILAPNYSTLFKHMQFLQHQVL